MGKGPDQAKHWLAQEPGAEVGDRHCNLEPVESWGYAPGCAQEVKGTRQITMLCGNHPQGLVISRGTRDHPIHWRPHQAAHGDRTTPGESPCCVATARSSW